MVALSEPIRQLAWKALKQSIRRRFPRVRQIDPRTLTDWLQQEPKPVLLDVRSPEEYAVSHLPDAQQIDPATKEFSFFSDSPDTPIVCYCSVGYRSARLCDRLQAAGYTQVANLEGSIFEWVNRGYPVYRAGQEARSVHPYSPQWGLLLNNADFKKFDCP